MPRDTDILDAEEACDEFHACIDEVHEFVDDDLCLEGDEKVAVLFAALFDAVNEQVDFNMVALMRTLRGLVDDAEDKVDRGVIIPREVHEGRLH